MKLKVIAGGPSDPGQQHEEVGSAQRLPDPPEPNDELFDTHEAARRMGLKYQTVVNARVYGGAGACPYHKIGSAVRYSARELEKYLRVNLTASTSEHYASAK